jgi:hypothetical protein
VVVHSIKQLYLRIKCTCGDGPFYKLILLIHTKLINYSLQRKQALADPSVDMLGQVPWILRRRYYTTARVQMTFSRVKMCFQYGCSLFY